MKCSILQPHYFPWCGYFGMIKNVKKFIFLDDVKFIKREWKNRNKIRKSKKSLETKWLTVPISKETKNNNLNKAQIDYSEVWQKVHINSIKEVYQNSPYFDHYSPEIFEIINTRFNSLAELNIYIIKYISKNFKFETEFDMSSKLMTSGKKDEKLINICKKISSNHYYANKLSKNYIDEKRFKISQISLEYQNYTPIIYDQFNNKDKIGWLGNLSILDLIFNHGFDSTKI